MNMDILQSIAQIIWICDNVLPKHYLDMLQHDIAEYAAEYE